MQRWESWAESSKGELRSSISSMVKRDVYLSDSLKANLHYDRKYGSEVNRVGFSFAREGIYIHKGAGRGQGGVIGGRWIDNQGHMKQRSDESAGLQGTGNRKPIRWFDPVIDRRLPLLADLVSEYSATMQINATTIFIEKITYIMANDLNRSIKIYIDNSDAMANAQKLEAKISSLRGELQKLSAEGKKTRQSINHRRRL